MKNILKKIWDYLSTPKGQRNTLLVILIIVIILFRGCGGDKIDKKVYDQNIATLTDSIRTYISKNGELVSEKYALIATTKNLKDLNENLAKEVKDLRDHPIVVIQYKVKIVHDTIYVKVHQGSAVFSDDSIVKTVPFDWTDSTFYDKNDYHILAGNYTIQVDTSLNVITKQFMITQDEIGMSFTTGLTENKDKMLEIFVKSPYPGFKPTAMDGALIDPRDSKVIKKFFPPKRWSVGPMIGYGFYFDPKNVTVGHGVTVGVAVSYGIFQWKSKK